MRRAAAIKAEERPPRRARLGMRRTTRLLENRMIISSALDYRTAARRKLPRFLFDYIDGGANAEDTLRANVADLRSVSLRQRVLKNVSDLSLATEWFGRPSELPVILAPVGLSGMFARRGGAKRHRPRARSDMLDSV